MKSERRYLKCVFRQRAFSSLIWTCMTALTTGCGEMSMQVSKQSPLEGSSLELCLLSVDPDSVFCAASYVSERGGHRYRGLPQRPLQTGGCAGEMCSLGLSEDQRLKLRRW